MLSACAPEQAGDGAAPQTVTESNIISYIFGWTGSTGFGSSSTADDVAASLSLEGSLFLITGATSSIGRHVTEVLLSRGAAVIVTCRAETKRDEVQTLFRHRFPAGDITCLECDLYSLASTTALATAVQALDRPLHAIIHCAALLATPFHLTQDGYEAHWGVNYVAPHVLTRLLLPLLRSTAVASGHPSRVVFVTCSTHYFTYRTGPQKSRGIDYRRVEGTDAARQYCAMEAFGQSKLALVLQARDLARRLQAPATAAAAAAVAAGPPEQSGGEGSAGGSDVGSVEVFAVHPGITVEGLARYWGHYPGSWQQYVKDTFASAAGYSGMVKTAEQAAGAVLFCAAHPAALGRSGTYWSDCTPAKPSRAARDAAAPTVLWQVTEESLQRRGINLGPVEARC